MKKAILGIHHITAIAGNAQSNVDFYTGLLGLRLVKITVNFDDPGTYHLYYGDGAGTAGTILTFFVWPGARRGRQGNTQVTETSFAVPPGSLPFWRDRLAAIGAPFGIGKRFDQQVLTLADPDGLSLALIETAVLDAARTWEGADVPLDFAIRGFHSATLSETGYERTAALLTGTMDFHAVGQEHDRFRYEVDCGGASRTVDLIRAPAGKEGRVAAGTVHHIAWRTADEVQQHEWLGQLAGLGYRVSPIMDRVYFHSIYFREPGGILFEIATDTPGFAVDEPLKSLGAGLRLPSWLEAQRRQIELVLPPIKSHGLERVASS